MQALSIKAQDTKFRFLQFNIWQEGTVVPNGFAAIVDEIIANKAGVITLSEVRNYKNTPFHAKIIDALKQKGHIYYSAYSYDSGILSRFPIEDFTEIFPHQDDYGSAYKAILNVQGKKIAAYTAHLDYRNAANYLPRGYDGNTWKKLPKKESSVEEILKINLASKRDEAIQMIIADAKKETAAGRFAILGVDLNEPSHRDWKRNTKNLFDHNGLVVPWQNTIMLEKHGWTDAYRKKYPNVRSHPGFTFPSYNADVPINKLTWAPEADDRDRIDFIFYLQNKNLKLEKISILGPNASIVNGKMVIETSHDSFIAPKGMWPTDHKAILATFTIK